MPYYIQRYKEKEDSLRNIFETHKTEATHLIEILDGQKLKFHKILDHMSSLTDTDQKPRQDKSTVFLAFSLALGIVIVRQKIKLKTT